MPTGHIQQPADVLITGHNFIDPALVHQLEAGMPVALPEPLLGLEMRQLLAGQRCEYTAIFQVALNAVTGNPIPNDRCAFEGHLPEQLRLTWPHGSLDDIDIAAVAVDDLPAITPRCTEADLRRFQHRDPKSVFQQKQSAGQACVTGSDDTHVSFDFALQHGTFRGSIG